MLQDLYSDINVYREIDRVDEWGNTSKKGNWQLVTTIQGYIQPRSGTYGQANQANVPLSSHSLYTDIGVELNPKDRVGLDDIKYRVNYSQIKRGIGGIMDHQEIPVDYLNDLS